MIRRRLANLLYPLLLLVMAAALAFLSTRWNIEHDISRGQQASLDQASSAVLAQMSGPVTVTSYARSGSDLRPLITRFFARYQRAKDDLTLHFVDPDADPAAMRELGVQLDGEFELEYQGRRERLQVLSEAEVSSALLRLSRERVRIVAFLEGHGERQPAGDGHGDLGQFMSGLAGQGIRTASLPLAATGSIPISTDLLVIAAPRVAPESSTLQLILAWLADGGNLLWLVEPNDPTAHSELARALSLLVLEGTVVDGQGAELGIGDPSLLAIASYPQHAITDKFQATTLFAQAAALGQRADAQWHLQPLLRSSAQSWTETGPLHGIDSVRYDSDDEIPGPLDIAFALSRLSPRPDHAEQRAVVIGDGDFLSNSFVGQGGNRELGQRVFNWLLADDALIDIPPRQATDRDLALSQGQLNLIGLVFLLGLPALLIGASALLRWRRRRR